MNRLELENARKLIEKFEELQEEFNSKYENSLDVRIDDDYELNISNDYFNYENVNKLEQAIIDYKRIIKG
ncbi:hypothetical protein [Spiroplasma endosymbiont of Danaus chrysippus]|uniref:hypothetical protein n=1 Tax=Spiroplasma endosymbiont of Danaus chrysippus TaxID=2691041 RepID=UPI0013C72E5A|nr:hypothetical protein [Spiroplasma endosymbiont of Danaus chrysippus]CAB1054971.1 hypothetical protein [Spiroplasma endosymbiont of Danaus chrysippus]